MLNEKKRYKILYVVWHLYSLPLFPEREEGGGGEVSIIFYKGRNRNDQLHLKRHPASLGNRKMHTKTNTGYHLTHSISGKCETIKTHILLIGGIDMYNYFWKQFGIVYRWCTSVIPASHEAEAGGSQTVKWKRHMLQNINLTPKTLP